MKRDVVCFSIDHQDKEIQTEERSLNLSDMVAIENMQNYLTDSLPNLTNDSVVENQPTTSDEGLIFLHATEPSNTPPMLDEAESSPRPVQLPLKLKVKLPSINISQADEISTSDTYVTKSSITVGRLKKKKHTNQRKQTTMIE